MAAQGGASRLAQMQMRFQQKQQQEREQRKLEITGTKSSFDTTDGKSISASFGNGKVRQMFDERRQRGTGIDKSYPLKPISVSKTTQGSTVTKSTVTSTFHKQRLRQVNGVTTETSEITTQRPIRADEEDYLNGNVSPESSNGNHYDNDEAEEFGDDVIIKVSTKLPNVGKLASSPSVDSKRPVNGDSGVIRNKLSPSYGQNNNSIKLKPLPTRKVSPVESNSKLGRKSAESLTKLSTVRTPTPTESGKSTPSRVERKPSSGGSLSNSSPSKKSVSSPVRMATPTKSRTPSKPSTPVKQPAIPPEGMDACRICGRFFNPDRIEKHESICQKTTVKKRKIFDAGKHRVKGTEAEKYVKKPSKAASRTTTVAPKPSAEAPSKKSDWRRKHEEFIQAIRAAKEMQAHLARGGKVSDLPPPPPSENPDYIQCPHCSRRFNEAAANRHIPKCATMLHNKPKPGAAPKKRR